MTRKKGPQPLTGEAAIAPQPDPEAVEKFDALMAEEARRMPAPPRVVGPVDVGKMIKERLDLPAGATLEFKSDPVVFRVPADEEKDHTVEAVITAADRATAKETLDAAIRAAEPGKTWAHEEARFFLHAVQYSNPTSTQISLKYIFRLRPSEA